MRFPPSRKFNDMRKIKLAGMFCLFAIALIAQERTNRDKQDIELGKVSWYRDYDIALEQSKQKDKPVLILFQEVPGCATCRNYGQDVLSNPLLVEAIEDQFVPLVIHNNKGGKDREVLNKYKEPTWNNPVVRIVDAQGKNLVKRVSGNYSAIGLYTAMEQALEKTYHPIPEYVQLLGEELSATKNRGIKETYFSMYCFWTGEKELGATDGVLLTEAGFMKGREVVKVTYDEQKISELELETYARQHDFKPIAKDNSYSWASNDEDYFLRRSHFKYLPLSDTQKTKINSALGKRENAEKYLSPSQHLWLQEIKANKTAKKEVLYNQSFAQAWGHKSQCP